MCVHVLLAGQFPEGEEGGGGGGGGCVLMCMHNRTSARVRNYVCVLPSSNALYSAPPNNFVCSLQCIVYRFSKDPCNPQRPPPTHTHTGRRGRGPRGVRGGVRAPVQRGLRAHQGERGRERPGGGGGGGVTFMIS